ncbi:MAG: isopeptide-forming domain-containing fimbrial protein [Coleofasciculaceae cyanobacterium RL_1_1]|nr:isopeptide-forming domain-containing fimbrial protein [Coleofasciculaceae cyanobacterium RL_1_1]
MFSDGQRIILDDPTLTPTLVIDVDGTAIDGSDARTYSFDIPSITNLDWFDENNSSGSTSNFEYTLRSRFRPETEQEAGTDTTPATTATNIFTDSGNTDGSTRLKFDISQLLKDKRAGSSGVLGNLLSADERNKITGRVVYHTEVQQNYTDLHHVTGFTGDRSVDAGDIIYNDAYIDGAVIDRATDPATIPDFDAFLDTLPREDDDTAASGSVPLLPEPVKRVYAVNSVAIETDADQKGFSITEEPTKLQRVKVGDLVTYRLTVAGIQAPDAEDFTITDYLPLPVYNVLENTAELTSLIETYDELATAGAGFTEVPIVNSISFGPDHDLFGPNQVANSNDAVLEADLQRTSVSTDAANNSFTVNFGKFNSLNEDPNRTYTFDILFTFEVQDKPFDDRLFLTNQARLSYDNTEASANIQDTIVRIETAQPVPIVEKTTTNPATSGGSAPVVDSEDLVTFQITVTNVGANSIYDLTIADQLPNGFEVPVDSAGNVDWTALDLSVSTANGGNRVAFTTAGSDSDQGTSLVNATGAIDTGATAQNVVDALFGSGIRLVDDTSNMDEFARGAVDPGRMTQAVDTTATGGVNELIISYKLRVADNAAASASYSNDAKITRYAAIDGGKNYADLSVVGKKDNQPRVNEGGDDLKPTTGDSTEVVIQSPTLTKSLFETEFSETNNNLTTQATIGERVVYYLDVTIPEGELTSATITDTLPPGMKFEKLQGAYQLSDNPGFGQGSVFEGTDAFVTALDADIDALDFFDSSRIVVNATSVGATTTGTGINGNPQIVTFTLGTLVNVKTGTADADDIDDVTGGNNYANPETIRLIYTAQVTNDAINLANTSWLQHDDALPNAAKLQWTSVTQTFDANGNKQVATTNKSVKAEIGVATTVNSPIGIENTSSFSIDGSDYDYAVTFTNPDTNTDGGTDDDFVTASSGALNSTMPNLRNTSVTVTGSEGWVTEDDFTINGASTALVLDTARGFKLPEGNKTLTLTMPGTYDDGSITTAPATLTTTSGPIATTGTPGQYQYQITLSNSSGSNVTIDNTNSLAASLPAGFSNVAVSNVAVTGSAGDNAATGDFTIGTGTLGLATGESFTIPNGGSVTLTLTGNYSDGAVIGLPDGVTGTPSLTYSGVDNTYIYTVELENTNADTTAEVTEADSGFAAVFPDSFTPISTQPSLSFSAGWGGLPQPGDFTVNTNAQTITSNTNIYIPDGEDLTVTVTGDYDNALKVVEPVLELRQSVQVFSSAPASADNPADGDDYDETIGADGEPLRGATIAANDNGTDPAGNAGDQKDTVEYRFEIKHPAPTDNTTTKTVNESHPTAYDVTFEDTFSEKIEGLTFTQFDSGDTNNFGLKVTDNNGSASYLDPSSYFEFVTVGTATKLQVKSGADIDILPGYTWEFVVQGTLKDTVQGGETIDNPAKITWSSIDDPDTNDGERDGSSGVGDQTSYLNDGDPDVTTDDDNSNDGISDPLDLDPSQDELTDPTLRNNYALEATTTIKISQLVPGKTIVGSSEGHTELTNGQTDANSGTKTEGAIGEIIRYRLAVELNEGTNTDLRLKDLLPPGLQFIDEGQVTYALVQPSGTSNLDVGSDLTNVQSGSFADVEAVLTTTAVTLTQFPASRVYSENGEDDTYDPGEDVVFNFGTVKNTDRTTGKEFIIVEFNALVTNEPTNQARNNIPTEGTTTPTALVGGMQVLANVNSDANSVVGELRVEDTDGNGTIDINEVGNRGTVDVVEPVLTINKSFLTTPDTQLDAGDEVTYRITIANTGNADAFDLNLADALATAGIDYGDVTEVAVFGSLPTDTNTPTVKNSDGIDQNVSGASTFAAGKEPSTLDAYINRLNDGETLVLDIKVKLTNDVQPGLTIDSDAQLTYSSVPGVGTPTSSADNTTLSQIRVETGATAMAMVPRLVMLVLQLRRQGLITTRSKITSRRRSYSPV